jgi:UDP-3-O-[3-hydroxymyristoyl] glucosamine N-acyltransferase
VRLADIAEAIGGVLHGDPEVRVQAINALHAAGADEIGVVWDPDLVADIGSSGAACVVVSEPLNEARAHIVVADPRSALAGLVELLYPEERPPSGVAAGAIVAEDASIADSAHVGGGARIGARATLGEGVVIHDNASIGADVVVGPFSVVHPNATLYPGVHLGRRVVIHSSAVIGCEGFGYDRTEGGHRKVPHVGTVLIEDDVEIGACVTVDRAVVGATVIRRGTKIDNLVQVAHNCDVGEHCVLVGQAGLAGSVQLGAWCQIGAQAGVSDHLTVGSGVRVAAKSGVAESLPSGDWLGLPAMPAAHARRVLALMGRLPEIYSELRELRQRCRALEAELAELRRD